MLSLKAGRRQIRTGKGDYFKMNEIDILEKMAYEPPLYFQNKEPLSALHFEKIKAEFRVKGLQDDLKNYFFIESKYNEEDERYIIRFSYGGLEFEIWTTYKDTIFYVNIKNVNLYKYESKEQLINLFINIACVI